MFRTLATEREELEKKITRSGCAKLIKERVSIRVGKKPA